MLRLLLACCLFLASGCASAPDIPPSRSAALAVVHVNVVDVQTGIVQGDQTVLIEGDRIRLVAPTRRTAVPAGAEIVEAKNKYVIPGLWDMGVHIFRHRKPPRTFAASWFPLFIANGVTSVRETFTNFDDEPLLRSFRAEIARGSLIGPKIVHAGPLVEAIAPGKTAPSHPGALIAQTEQEARSLVGAVRAYRLDYINVHELPREVYLALAAESRKQGLPFAGKVPKWIDIVEASDAGQRSITLTGIAEACSADGKSHAQWAEIAAREWYSYVRELLKSQEPARCRPAFERLATNGTTVSANLVTKWAAYVGDPRWTQSENMKYIPAEWRRDWENGLVQFPPNTDLETSFARQQARYVGAMHRLGVPILSSTLVGNDFLVAGFSLHENLELLVSEAGLTPLQALRTATLNPARHLGAAEMGEISNGNVADLVILDGNPLVDIKNTQRIQAVILNGRYFDRTALDALLKDAEGVVTARETRGH